MKKNEEYVSLPPTITKVSGKVIVSLWGLTDDSIMLSTEDLKLPSLISTIPHRLLDDEHNNFHTNEKVRNSIIESQALRIFYRLSRLGIKALLIDIKLLRISHNSESLIFTYFIFLNAKRVKLMSNKKRRREMIENLSHMMRLNKINQADHSDICCFLDDFIVLKKAYTYIWR